MSGLDDVRAKFGRALQHHGDADTALHKWSDRNPYRILARRDSGGWFALVLEVNEPPPVGLALMRADSIHNLRACLDLLVCGIIEAQGKPVNEWNGFPVVKESKDWLGRAGRDLDEVPRPWRRVIKQYQPFAYGQDFAKHPLWWIHRFDIDSKHRTVIPLVLRAMRFSPPFEFNRPIQDGDWVEDEPVTFDRPFADGMVVMRARARSKNEDLRILGLQEISEAATLAIGFGVVPSGNPPPVQPIPALIAYVGTVIDALAPAFT